MPERWEAREGKKSYSEEEEEEARKIPFRFVPRIEIHAFLPLFHFYLSFTLYTLTGRSCSSIKEKNRSRNMTSWGLGVYCTYIYCGCWLPVRASRAGVSHQLASLCLCVRGSLSPWGAGVSFLLACMVGGLLVQLQSTTIPRYCYCYTLPAQFLSFPVLCQLQP